MTFAQYENSIEESQPVELYTFTLGGTVYRYTSSEATENDGTNDFTAKAIKRGRLEQSREEKASLANIELPATDAFAANYINRTPGEKATVQIRRFQRPDGATPELILLFSGVVESVKFTNNGQTAVVNVSPLVIAFSRPIPRFTYQSMCNHFLYDESCTVLKTDYDETATVTSVSGANITVGSIGQPLGYYQGGYVERSNGETRAVLANDTLSTVFTILLPFFDDITGETVTFYAGCDHTISTCKTKFNNVINYGGFAYVPTRNVFEIGIETSF